MNNEYNKNLFNAILGIMAVSLTIAGVLTIIKGYEVFERSSLLLKDSRYASSAATLMNFAPIKDSYNQAFMYFLLALGVIFIMLVYPRLSSFSIGNSGINIALNALQTKVSDLATQNRELQESSLGSGGKGLNIDDLSNPHKPFAKMKAAMNPNYPDDPQKGRWGGLSTSNGRTIYAQVTQVYFLKGWYKVVITVTGTPDSQHPLTGLVKFHLHNTFMNPVPVIAAEKGKAVLTLNMVYGAFTVGAEADYNGDIWQTKLELDLSLDENFPGDFRSK